MSSALVLENGYFLLADGTLFHGSMRIESGRIAKISKSLPKQKGEKRVSVKGNLIIPGFVQTHIHLCQTLFRNLADDLPLLDWLGQKIWPMEAAHSEKSLYASARLGIGELLAGGTTTILDMGTVKHTDIIFEAAQEMGLRAFIGKCLMDRDSSPAGLRENTKRALKEDRELCERWNGKADGRLHYAHAPRFVLSCTETLLREVSEISRQYKTLIHTHSSENRDEIAAVKQIYGAENIEVLEKLGLTGPNLVLAHCIWLSARERKILAKTGTHVSHCPSSNLKLASGLCSVPQLRKEGISVSIGADGAPCNNNLNMFQEMRLASLLQKPIHGASSMPAKEVFELATIAGARALGLENEIGSIAIGKKADLVEMDLNFPATATSLDEKYPERVFSALVYSCSPQQVKQTWIEGKSVYKEGNYPGIDASAIVQNALKEQKNLLKRL